MTTVGKEVILGQMRSASGRICFNYKKGLKGRLPLRGVGEVTPEEYLKGLRTIRDRLGTDRQTFKKAADSVYRRSKSVLASLMARIEVVKKTIEEGGGDWSESSDIGDEWSETDAGCDSDRPPFSEGGKRACKDKGSGATLSSSSADVPSEDMPRVK